MLKKISVEHLVVGMHIHEICGSWMDHPFWRSNFILSSPDDLQRLRSSGITELWINVAKGLDIAAAESQAESEAKVELLLQQSAHGQAAVKPVPAAEELKRAAKICASSKAAVISMFREVRMGKAVSAEAAGELVEQISTSITRNPSALISLARLKSADDYTYMHSVAVCALAVALARQLKLDEEVAHQIGIGALMHDMGKAFTPREILNKPDKLSDAEFAVMRRHTEDGHRALLQGGANDLLLDVSRHHHERIDGSGYPDRLAADQISQAAKMVAICDVYDAITSDRPYKAGWDPAESIRKMAEWCSGHFDESIFQAFVKSVGIYPVGSLVRLQSGRLAVVIEQSDKSLITPTVKMFFSTKSRAYIRPEVVTLSQAGVQDAISGRENAADWGIKNLEQFWAQ